MNKSERTRALRYKRPALASMSYHSIMEELWEIQEACNEVAWYTKSEDGTDALLAALDGNEDEAWEFQMAFSDLSSKCEELVNALEEIGEDEDMYDTCTVALIGNRYNLEGYDSYMEDYYSLVGYERNLAATEAGKRLMRLTKPEMIATIGQCVGTLVAFLDLRQTYDYLKATMDIIRDTNVSLLGQIRAIEDAYDAADAAHWRGDPADHFRRLLEPLPDRLWVE